MNPEKRFEGEIAEEYRLNKLVFPHQDKVEKQIGLSLSKYSKKISTEKLKCLEIGCGTGITSKIILDSDSRIHLTALDSSSPMVKQVKNNLGKSMKRVDIVIDDALHYVDSLKPKSFDIIASAYTIHNFVQDYRTRIIKGIYSALSEGGLFINADIIYSVNKDEREKEFNYMAKRLMTYYPKLGRGDLGEKWLAHITEDFKPERIILEHDYIKQLKAACFRNVEKHLRSHSDAVISAIK